MGVVTIYRLAESCLSLIEGGDIAEGSSLSYNEIKNKQKESKNTKNSNKSAEIEDTFRE